MAILVLYGDLRQYPSKLIKAIIERTSNMVAFDAVKQALGQDNVEAINEDLKKKTKTLIVSWYNAAKDDISEIGGVGSLNWVVEDHTIITVTYDGQAATQEQLDEFEKWSVENSKEFFSKLSKS